MSSNALKWTLGISVLVNLIAGVCYFFFSGSADKKEFVEFSPPSRSTPVASPVVHPEPLKSPEVVSPEAVVAKTSPEKSLSETVITTEPTGTDLRPASELQDAELLYRYQGSLGERQDLLRKEILRRYIPQPERFEKVTGQPLCPVRSEKTGERWEHWTFEGETLDYWISFQADALPTRPLPLLIMLPEGNASPEIIQADWNRYCRQAAIGFKAIVVMPCLPPKEATFERVADRLLEALLRELIFSYHIDRRAIYLGGCASGASGVFRTMTHRPDLFAAYLTIGGYLADIDDWALLDNVRESPFSMLVAEQDPRGQTASCIRMHDTLVQAKIQHRYKLCPTVPEIPQADQMAEWNWLFKQKNAPFDPNQLKKKKLCLGLRTSDPTSNRIGSLRLTGFNDTPTMANPARLFMTLDDGNKFEIQAIRNVRRFQLLLHPALLKMDKPIIVLHDKKEIFRCTIPKPDLAVALEEWNACPTSPDLFSIRVDVEIK